LTRFITLAEYFWLAEQVTGVDGVTLPEPPGPSSRSTRRRPASEPRTSTPICPTERPS